MNEVVTVKSARAGASTVHLAINVGWSSPPLCGAMKTGKREFTNETANCTPCVKMARSRFLDVDGLVRISSRVWNLINAVKAHAMANYDNAGWDIVIEAYSDSELAELVQSCRTAKGAIARVADMLSIYTERRSHHRAEAAAATDHPEPVAPVVSSIICWSGSAETEWYGIETWPGKVGHNEHDPNEGVRYVSGFHLNLVSPGACDHSSRGDGLYCRQDGCRHAECVVPF
jgi:hypothetical protein